MSDMQTLGGRLLAQRKFWGAVFECASWKKPFQFVFVLAEKKSTSMILRVAYEKSATPGYILASKTFSRRNVQGLVQLCASR